MDSILETVKAHLGLTEDDITFNEQIIDDINSVFMILHQLGVGPSEYFAIEDESETWNDFFGDAKNVNAVKTYMYMKVKLMFDPPTTSFFANIYAGPMQGTGMSIKLHCRSRRGVIQNGIYRIRVP